MAKNEAKPATEKTKIVTVAPLPVAKKAEKKTKNGIAQQPNMTPLQSSGSAKSTIENRKSKIAIVDPSTARNAPVPTSPDKFALIIGNTDSRFEGGKLPYAADDAQLIRETLTASAGYA